jgi:lipopolysaccharide exporter
MSGSGETDGRSLVRSAVSGIAWNWGGMVMLVGAQVGSTIASARLVSPAEFGLYAVGQAAFGLSGFFSLAAVGQGLQRRKELSHSVTGTAVTMSLGAGALFAAIMILGASLWADAWGVPDSAWVVRIFGIAAFLQAAGVVPISLIRRDLRFRSAAVMETGSLVFAMALGVALAVKFHSAASLAAGQAAGYGLLLIISALKVGHRLTPAFHPDEGKELMTFSSQVGALGFVAYLTSSLPGWFAARQFGSATLGLYSRANLLATLPGSYAVNAVYKVIYPLYGRVREDIERRNRLLEEAQVMATGLAWPAFALLAGLAPLVVHVLLGQRWAGAAPLLSLCSLGVCATIPTGLLTNFAEALGWMRILALRQVAISVAVVVALVAVSIGNGSIELMLIGVVAAQWLAYFATLTPYLGRHVLAWGRTIHEQAVHALVALGAYGVSWAAVHLTRHNSIVVQIGAGVLATALTVGSFLIFRRWIPAGRLIERRLQQVRNSTGGTAARLANPVTERDLP